MGASEIGRKGKHIVAAVAIAVVITGFFIFFPPLHNGDRRHSSHLVWALPGLYPGHIENKTAWPSIHHLHMHKVSLLTCLQLCCTKIMANFSSLAKSPSCSIILCETWLSGFWSLNMHYCDGNSLHHLIRKDQQTLKYKVASFTCHSVP